MWLPLSALRKKKSCPGASRVHDLFEQAKKDAPSLVFIEEIDEEIDTVGKLRGGATKVGGHDT